MLVAIIDDGIISESYNTGKLRYDITVTENGYIKRRKPSENITSMHGTTIAGIIKKYAPAAEFCSIKVFHEAKSGKLATSPLKLYYAMRWCLDKRIPVIHLSLGTTDPAAFGIISGITDRLLRNGHIIVAAASYNGKYTLPANLPGVLGVKADASLAGNKFLKNVNAEGVKYLASSIHELQSTNGSHIITPLTNSFAAPTVTAAVVLGVIGNGHSEVPE